MEYPYELVRQGKWTLDKLYELTKDMTIEGDGDGATSMVYVPVTCKDLERASVVIEALASGAYKTITPVLYETYPKRKVTRDADSADMIEYIVRNRVFDMGYVNLSDGIGSFVREMLTTKKTDVSSTVREYKRKSQSDMEKLVESYKKSASS